MRQTNRETKGNQRDKKDEILILFNKVDKGCVLDKAIAIWEYTPHDSLKIQAKTSFFIHLFQSIIRFF